LSSYIAQLESAAWEARRCVAEIKRLALAKGISESDFTMRVVARSEQYLEGELALGRRIADRLRDEACTGAEPLRREQDFDDVLRNIRRMTLYVESQICRIDRDVPQPAPPTKTRADVPASGQAWSEPRPDPDHPFPRKCMT
jgi:hypothetical protein